MKPPLRSEGTTATHSADLRRSSGMPVSGADSISSSTVPAALMRSSALVLSLVSSAVRVGAQKANVKNTGGSFFIQPQIWDVQFLADGTRISRRTEGTGDGEPIGKMGPQPAGC